MDAGRIERGPEEGVLLQDSRVDVEFFVEDIKAEIGLDAGCRKGDWILLLACRRWHLDFL
jgi:hypothetical protein